jgi:hypothetical protein
MERDMKNLVVVFVASLLLCSAQILCAQTYTFTKLDPTQSLMASEHVPQIPGCSCHMGKGYAYNGDKMLEQIFLNPTAVQTPANQSVQIRYDASAICGGQTIRDVDGHEYASAGFEGVGTIEWEPGVVQHLPEGFGLVTLSGYSQPKSAQITVKIAVQCYDIGAKCTMPNKYTNCTLSSSIPLTVTLAGKKAPQKGE